MRLYIVLNTFIIKPYFAQQPSSSPHCCVHHLLVVNIIRHARAPTLLLLLCKYSSYPNQLHRTTHGLRGLGSRLMLDRYFIAIVILTWCIYIVYCLCLILVSIIIRDCLLLGIYIYIYIWVVSIHCIYLKYLEMFVWLSNFLEPGVFVWNIQLMFRVLLLMSFRWTYFNAS